MHGDSKYGAFHGLKMCAEALAVMSKGDWLHFPAASGNYQATISFCSRNYTVLAALKGGPDAIPIGSCASQPRKSG